MTSSEENTSRMRSARIPDELWAQLEEWAAASGVGDSDALRRLLRIGLKTKPFAPVREPQRWMLRNTEIPAGEMLLVAVTGKDAWWDLDEAVTRMPGCVTLSRGGRLRWHAIPAKQLGTIRTLFAGRSAQLVIHNVPEARL